MVMPRYSWSMATMSSLMSTYQPLGEYTSRMKWHTSRSSVFSTCALANFAATRDLGFCSAASMMGVAIFCEHHPRSVTSGNAMHAATELSHNSQ